MRLRRVARLALVVFAVVVAALVLLKRWASGTAMRDRVRATVASRWPTAELGDEFFVDWAAGVHLGPLTLGGDLLTVRQLVVHPRWAALLRLEFEPAFVELDDVVVDAGDEGEALRAFLTQARDNNRANTAPSKPTGAAGNPRAQLPEVRIEGLIARATLQGRALELRADAVRLLVHRDDAQKEVHLDAVVRPAHSGGDITVVAAFNEEGVREGMVRFEGDVPMASLVPLEMPFVIERGRLWGEVHFTTRAHHRVVDAQWHVGVDELRLKAPRLASEPVGPMELRVDATTRLDVQRELSLELVDARVSLGPEGQLVVAANATLSEGQWSLEAHTVEMQYEKAIAAMPAQLAVGGIGNDITGPFSFKLEVKGPLRKPLEWQVTPKLDLTALRQRARLTPQALSRPFTHRMTLADGRTRELFVGPAQGSTYVPLELVPRVMIRAVLLSEDSMFMSHQGFDFLEMKNDLFAPSEGVVRGASTITQQLAKNLFLTRERTYARKVREAFLTIALEAALPKERLLEIYLNIIEWGPGIYGLGEASRHYFGKVPSALTTREAAYLASIIPGPNRYYGFFVKRELPEVWEQRLVDLFGKLRTAKDLTDDEYRDALEAKLNFVPK